MKRVLITKKMMWVVMMLLPSLVFSTVKAQDVLKLDLEKALEIALSENPTVKVADKEIEKKSMHRKVHMPLCSLRLILQPIIPAR